MVECACLLERRAGTCIVRGASSWLSLQRGAQATRGSKPRRREAQRVPSSCNRRRLQPRRRRLGRSRPRVRATKRILHLRRRKRRSVSILRWTRSLAPARDGKTSARPKAPRWTRLAIWMATERTMSLPRFHRRVGATPGASLITCISEAERGTGASAIASWAHSTGPSRRCSGNEVEAFTTSRPSCPGSMERSRRGFHSTVRDTRRRRSDTVIAPTVVHERPNRGARGARFGPA